MANSYFQFKQFTIHQDRCAMKVTTDACLFGAWTAEDLALLPSTQSPTRILDIGTGTGLLSLMIAQKNSGILIDAIELDREAAEQARENMMASPWKDRVRLIQGDARVYPFQYTYDRIITNPPFYEKEWKSPDTKRSIAQHQEGLLLADWLPLAGHLIAPNGYLYLLYSFKRKKVLEDALAGQGWEIQKLVEWRPSPGRAFNRIMVKAQRNKGEKLHPRTEEGSVLDAAGHYTPMARQLLCDYYLHL